MNIRLPALPFAALCYTYAGVFLWLLEWVKPVYSIPVIGLLGFGLYRFLRDPSTQEKIKVSKGVLVFSAILLLLYTLLCGSGGLFVQTFDWLKHNAILHDLISEGWPVYYHHEMDHAMLTYYIGQYLVPAAIGKLFHSFRAGELAMLAWNFAGIFLSVMLLFHVSKADTWRKQIFSVFVFCFFSAVLFLSRLLYAATAINVNDVISDRYFLSNLSVFFRSTLNTFRWIPTNGPPAWIAAALFAQQQDSPKYYLLIAAPLLLHASLPFLGLALLMLGIFVIKMARPDTLREERVRWLKDSVSIPNLCALLGLMVEAVYLMGNVAEEKPAEVGISFIEYGANSALYFCFCAGFICYSAVIFKTFKEIPLFYVVNAQLLLLPFFKFGLYNDLCMNASIPAMFLLMVFVIRGMFQYTLQQGVSHGRVVLLSLLLIWGAIYPIQEAYETMAAGPAWDDSHRFDPAGTLNMYARRDGSVGADMAYNYYTYDYEESLFYLWFAKE